MKFLQAEFVIATVLAIGVNSQIGVPVCTETTAEETKFFLNRKYSNTTYTIEKLLVPPFYSNLHRIDRNLPVRIILHGWNQTAQNPLIEELLQAYLKEEDRNVIRVDYGAVAAQHYAISLTKASDIVADVFNLIKALKINALVPYSAVNLLGHSLGGQICGLVGKKIFEDSGEKIGRIIALDPAREGFESVLVADCRKLTKGDTIKVVVIHTDAGEAGVLASLGHVDFYPNGGKKLQPNCAETSVSNVMGFTETDGWNYANTTDSFCSHERSIRYLAASVNSRIEATKCDSWTDYQGGNCANNEKVNFGEHLEDHAEGDFYLNIAV